MVLDELIFDPASQEGSSSFSVVQGVFVFVSGEIASQNPDAMEVRTPVATLGIRGTKVAGYAAQEGEENKIALLSEGDGEVGELIVYNPSGNVVLDQVNETTIVSSVFLAPEPTYISSNEKIFNLVSQAPRVLPEGLRIPDPNADGNGAGGREDREGEQGGGDELEADAAAQDDAILNELAADGEEQEGEDEYSEEELEGSYEDDYSEEYLEYVSEIEPAAGEYEEEVEAPDYDIYYPTAADFEPYSGYVHNATLTDPAYVYTAPTPVFDVIDEPDVVDEVVVVPPDPLVFTEINGSVGNDVLPWNFSVGNAIIDGGEGFDTVAVDTTDSSLTAFSLNASGSSVDMRVGGFILDMTNVEAIDIVGGSGTDSITVGNLDGTAITDNSVTFSGGGGNDILSGTYASKRH